MKETIPVYIESEDGHTTLDVTKDNIEGEVKKQLKDGKWVTVEKEDGTSEVLTEKDLPGEKKEAVAAWEGMFVTKKDFKTSAPPPEMVAATTNTKSSTKQFSKKFEKVRSITSTKTVKGG